MRYLIMFVMATILALPASAEWLSLSGQLVTVRVDGVPQDTTQVTLDLGEKLQGLELKQEGGAWVGSYAALPELTNPIFRPAVTVYDENHTPSPLDTASGASVEMASSEFDGSAVAAGILDKETLFVFDSDISPSSIELQGDQDQSVRPLLGHQTFQLPEGLSPQSLTSIAARTKEGRALVFSSPPDVDVAGTEEELEL